MQTLTSKQEFSAVGLGMIEERSQTVVRLREELHLSGLEGAVSFASELERSLDLLLYNMSRVVHASRREIVVALNEYQASGRY
jgi:hypothetical protein